ncbi:MAG: single-stranded-DNA-specific exonuclease RecJ [Bacteroidales bacterium]|nr:single-stranded-DNA-specific exonuclease RecJ [Bacteroidales bacterium]
MKENFWRIKAQGDPTDVDHLSKALKINKTLANLLVQRGIRTYSEAETFFRPEKSQLHDPFLMKDMDKAVSRIERAISNNERVLIYGDYDVDGTTAVAMVYSFLKSLCPQLEFYIPNRYEEGYGVSIKSIDYAAENHISLIITLDCGIKAIDKVCYAASKGIEFIICDHHYTGENLPEACAILNPKRPDCCYPYKHLSGCGVGFKLIQALALRMNLPQEMVMKHLDLVAVSIASDIVPITGENRVLAFLGLDKINTNPGVGIASIIKIAGLGQKRITIDDIVFKIGPRINAAGRMDTGEEAVKLLTAEVPEEAMEIGENIDEYNKQRKSIDQSLTSEALQMIESDPEQSERKTTVLFNPHWNKGVIGIVASRLIESHYRPTVILTESNGFASGSARSVEGFDLYSAIDRCSHLLENFGGHMYAAGITLKVENIAAFKQKFEEIVAETISEEQSTPVIEIDTQIELGDITPKFYRILKQFEPHGPENPQPIFLTKNVVDNGNGRTVGTNGEHLRLELIQESTPFEPIQAIGFQMGSHFEYIKTGNPFDICYTIDENEFRGNISRQIKIKDIK